MLWVHDGFSFVFFMIPFYGHMHTVPTQVVCMNTTQNIEIAS